MSNKRRDKQEIRIRKLKSLEEFGKKFDVSNIFERVRKQVLTYGDVTLLDKLVFCNTDVWGKLEGERVLRVYLNGIKYYDYYSHTKEQLTGIENEDAIMRELIDRSSSEPIFICFPSFTRGKVSNLYDLIKAGNESLGYTPVKGTLSVNGKKIADIEGISGEVTLGTEEIQTGIVRESTGEGVDELLNGLEYEYKVKYLRDLVDRMLDEKDKEGFLGATRKLNEVLQEKG